MSLDKTLNPQPKKQSDKQRFYSLIHGVNRIGIDELLEWIEESDYFKAPASTKFHGNYEGGLLKHCLKVHDIFDSILLRNKVKINRESVIICALFHDLCKVNTYFPKFLKNGSRAKTPYETIDSIPLGHGAKSVWRVQQFMRLSTEEAMIIRWHMNIFDRNYLQYQSKIQQTHPITTLFFCADYIATTLEGLKK